MHLDEKQKRNLILLAGHDGNAGLCSKLWIACVSTPITPGPNEQLWEMPWPTHFLSKSTPTTTSTA